MTEDRGDFAWGRPRLRHADSGGVAQVVPSKRSDPGSLHRVLERGNLFAQVAKAALELERRDEIGDYEGIFEQLSSLGPAIDTFFDQVRVNVEEKDLKERRRAFLREIHGLFALYADFAAVVLDNSVTHRKAQTCALADVLGREERFKDFIEVFGRDAAALIDK